MYLRLEWQSEGVGKRWGGGFNTQRDIVVLFYGYVLLDFDLVDGLENGEPMAHTVQAHLLELRVLECDEDIACNCLLCTGPS